MTEPDGLTTRVDVFPTATVVTVAGEVDLAVAEPLRRALQEACATPRDLVAVDLSDVSFLDSTGLHALVTAHKRLAERNARLVVVVPPGLVRRVMELSGLTGMIEVAERLEDALAPEPST
jgi:anti-anti-sigma factor